MEAEAHRSLEKENNSLGNVLYSSFYGELKTLLLTLLPKTWLGQS